MPKLLLTFDGQGLLIDQQLTGWCQDQIAALDTFACGRARHHATEDRPREIAAAISSWIDRHQLRD